MPSKWIVFARVCLSTLILLSGTWFSTRTSLARDQTTLPENHLNSPVLVRDLKTIEITADTFGLPKADHTLAGLYEKPSVFLHNGEKVNFKATIPEGGVYTISMD